MSIRDLIPWRERNDPLAGLRQDMDSLLSEFSRSSGWPAAMAATRFLPTLDVSETVEGYRIVAELPGVEPKNVQVGLEGDALVISGEKHDEKEEKGREWYHRERSSGSFRRAVRLPVTVDASKAQATYDKGVLTVDVPKRAEASANRRQIEVKTK